MSNSGLLCAAGLAAGGCFPLLRVLRAALACLKWLALAAAAQVILSFAVILRQLVFLKGGTGVALFQSLDGFIEQQGCLCAVRCNCRVGSFVAGGADGVAGMAGGRGMHRVAQQIQRAGGVSFRVQQHPHTQGSIQLLPAGLAGKVRHTVVVIRAFLLAGGDMFQQRIQTVRPGLALPVPAQQAAADLIAGSLDLKSHL